MIKSTKNKAILTAFACALCFGLMGAATLQTVYAENLSTTALVGTKSGVTVSDSSGLRLKPDSATEAWSAQLNALFTGKTEISYSLPERTAAENWTVEANSFTVKDFYGEEVARFIIGCDHWNVRADDESRSNAFLYNALTGEYTTAKITDNAVVANEYKVMTTTEIKEFVMKPGFYPSPAPNTGEGAVTFDYADGKLTVSTSTFDHTGINDDDPKKVGNGQTVTVGEMQVNLDSGYTVTVGSATDLSLPDGNAFSYGYSGNVLISSINGFDTTKAFTTGDRTGEIVYYSEKAQESGNPVISLTNGASLNKFYYVEQTACTDGNGKTFSIAPSLTAFDYADNHAFTAREEITVTYGEASKGYVVQVNGLPTVATKDLITNASENVTRTVSGSIIWNPKGAQQKLNGLLVTGPQKEAWSADLNGVFTGSTSISYYLTEFAEYGSNTYTASAFTIKKTNGDTVADFVIMRNHWADWFNSGAYVFDATNNKYMTQNTYWINSCVRYTGVKELTPAANADAAEFLGFTSTPWYDSNFPRVSPTILCEGDESVDSNYGTVTFEYVGTTLTIKTTTYDTNGNYEHIGDDVVGCGQTITIGEITGVDLSEGYTISMGSAPNVPYTDEGSFVYNGYSPFLLVKIDGQDVTGAMVQATGVTQDIQTTNTVNNGVIELSKGEALAFESNSTVSIGAMQMKSAAGVTVNTVYGSYAEFGDSGVVTVKDSTGARKDFSVRVKGLSEELTGTEMNAGASIRTAEPYGIRFQMNVSAADKALIEGNVGADKAYVSVKYGMIIMPYSYVAQYGGLTEENLFGESAVYTWKDKVGSGTTQIMLRYSENGLQANGGNYALWYANTGLTGSAITMKFIGAGFIELTKADGTKDYKIVSKYEGYNENDETAFANTNVRSCYEVAVMAYEDKSATAPSDTVKQFLLENYLIPNGYEQGNGGE